LDGRRARMAVRRGWAADCRWAGVDGSPRTATEFFPDSCSFGGPPAIKGCRTVSPAHRPSPFAQQSPSPTRPSSVARRPRPLAHEPAESQSSALAAPRPHPGDRVAFPLCLTPGPAVAASPRVYRSRRNRGSRPRLNNQSTRGQDRPRARAIGFGHCDRIVGPATPPIDSRWPSVSPARRAGPA
jgi:hypothetical protein